jgi:hypothetical protein
MKVLLYQFHLQKRELTFATKTKILGDYGEYWKLSSESCKQYADKWGWDYIFDNPTEDEWKPFCIPEPQFEQFRSIKYLNDYDAVLFVDTDVLIKTDSPNVVEEYRNDQTNLVVNTAVGNRLLNGTDESSIGVNTGVVLWFRDSPMIQGLPGIIPENNYYIGDTFILGSFIEERKHLKWWKQLEDFQPFIGKFQSGFYNDDKFLTFLISVWNIPVSHLHEKYNYRFSAGKKCDIMSDENWFIHYADNNKSLMKQHYNIIME